MIYKSLSADLTKPLYMVEWERDLSQVRDLEEWQWGLLSLLPRIVTHYLGGGESEGSDVTVPSSVQIR